MKLKSCTIIYSFLFCLTFFGASCKTSDPNSAVSLSAQASARYANIIINDKDKLVEIFNHEQMPVISFKYKQLLSEQQKDKISEIYANYGVFGIMNFVSAQQNFRRISLFDTDGKKSAEIKKIQLNNNSGESALLAECFSESELLKEIYGVYPGEKKIIIQDNAGAGNDYELESAQVHIVTDGPEKLYYVGNDYFTNILGRIIASKEKRTSFKTSLGIRTRTLGKGRENKKNMFYAIDFKEANPVSGRLIEQTGPETFNITEHTFSARKNPVTDYSRQNTGIRNDGQKEWLTEDRENLYKTLETPNMQRNSVFDNYFAAMTNASYIEADESQNLYFGKEKVNVKWLEMSQSAQYCAKITS